MLQTVLISKLNAKNYLLWEYQIMNLIDSQGFRSFINGTISIPPKNILITLPDRSLQEVENPDHIAWQKSDNLLKGWITGTLRKEVCCYAVGLHTSYELWMTLQKVLAQQSVEREFHLQEVAANK